MAQEPGKDIEIMRNNKVFRTNSIELAAFLVTIGHKPFIISASASRRALFIFVQSAALRRAIGAHECNLKLPAKRLLEVRKLLRDVISQEVAGGVGL